MEDKIYKTLELNIIRKGYIERNKDDTIIGYRLVENDVQTFYKYHSSNNIFDIDQGLQTQILDMQNIIYKNLILNLINYMVILNLIKLTNYHNLKYVIYQKVIKSH